MYQVTGSIGQLAFTSAALPLLAAAVAVAFAIPANAAIFAAKAATGGSNIEKSVIFSTMSQLKLMIAKCIIGAYLAALVHLLGHPRAKATLFLGSRLQIRRKNPPVAPFAIPSLGTRATVGVAASALAFAASAEVPDARNCCRSPQTPPPLSPGATAGSCG